MRTTGEAIKQFKHICWYPSAGKDFRPLLFISDWYYMKNNVPKDDGQKYPDLFILTDLCGLFGSHGDTSCFGDAYYQLKEGFCEPDARLAHIEYKNSSTEIIVKKIEKLRDLGLPFDHDCFRNGKGIFQPNILRRRTDLHLNFPFFDPPAHILVKKCGLGRINCKANFLLLALFQMHPHKSLKFLHRADHGSIYIPQVELHYFRSGSTSCIFDFQTFLT